MGRPWREEYVGGIYHVIARGNNKEYIFREDIDKGYFIKQIKEMFEGMGFRIYAYALMDNHYHLLIQTMNKPLQKVMHQLNNKYSKYYNYKYKRVGHVFQGRYKAIRVQDERYLMRLIRYIHQNPMEAKISTRVEDYKWSSDIFYRQNIRGFITTDIPLQMLSKDRHEAISKYKEYMAQKDENDYESKPVIGDDAYENMCKSGKVVEEKNSLNEVLKETGINEADYELIKSGSRKRYLTESKIVYAKAAKSINYTYAEIGSNISMTDTAVRNMIERHK